MVTRWWGRGAALLAATGLSLWFMQPASAAQASWLNQLSAGSSSFSSAQNTQGFWQLPDPLNPPAQNVLSFYTAEPWVQLRTGAVITPGAVLLNSTRSSVQNPQAGVCTVGFLVRNQAGEKFVLTAGHCGEVGDGFVLNDGKGKTNRVATLVKKEFSQTGKIEYALLRLEAGVAEQPFFATEFLTQPGALPSQPAAQATHWEQPLSLAELKALRQVNLCSVGWRSGLACGPLRAADLNTGVGEYAGMAGQGDSGSPVFVMKDGKFYPAGILSYETKETAGVGFVSLPVILERLQVTLQ